MKDYYATLGVTAQAEYVVIKAAYRALAQCYHPDRYAGDAPEDAEQRMREINEAYAVLSDPKKRETYDAEYRQAFEQEENNFDLGDDAAEDGLAQLDQDWATAIEYYPDLVDLEAGLSRTSKRLGFMFRLLMIDSKRFRERQSVAKSMHDSFLQKYFGDNAQVLNFAKALINLDRKDAAKALNEAVRVLGTDLDPTVVIQRIRDKFDLNPRPTSVASGTGEAERKNGPIFVPTRNYRLVRFIEIAQRPSAVADEVRTAIEELGGTFSRHGDSCQVKWRDQVYSFENGTELCNWFVSFIAPRIRYT